MKADVSQLGLTKARDAIVENRIEREEIPLPINSIIVTGFGALAVHPKRISRTLCGIYGDTSIREGGIVRGLCPKGSRAPVQHRGRAQVSRVAQVNQARLRGQAGIYEATKQPESGFLVRYLYK